tara:strand:+ start:178 stop:402 length:225 start_codon:yes stop_codon:yes gene_type:complete
MQNLLQQLKPEVKECLLLRQKQSPYIINFIFKDLEKNIDMSDITYGTFLNISRFLRLDLDWKTERTNFIYNFFE